MSNIKNIKKHLTFIISVAFFYLVLSYPLPYYVESPGGIKDIAPKIVLANGRVNDDTFFETYIEVRRGNLPVLLFAYFNKEWQVYKESESEYQDYDLENKINKMRLQLANDKAIITAFKYADLEYEILKENIYVIHKLSEANNELQSGDIILDYNLEELQTLINSKQSGDLVILEVKRDDEIIITQNYLIDDNNSPKLGIYLDVGYDIITEPAITINNEKQEQGTSAGFMTALTIFDKITNYQREEVKIAGTGTITSAGEIGPVGALELKIIAADKENVDYFFVPMQLNYEEAIKTKEKYNLKLEIVGFNNFDEAIKFLYPELD